MSGRDSLRYNLDLDCQIKQKGRGKEPPSVLTVQFSFSTREEKTLIPDFI